MSDMPERISVDRALPIGDDDYEGFWHLPEHSLDGDTEYVRADVAAEQTRQAVREALADALGIVLRSEGDTDFAEFQVRKMLARLDAEGGE
jgi:hypothetical protein